MNGIISYIYISPTSVFCQTSFFCLFFLCVVFVCLFLQCIRVDTSSASSWVWTVYCIWMCYHVYIHSPIKRHTLFLYFSLMQYNTSATMDIVFWHFLHTYLFKWCSFSALLVQWQGNVWKLEYRVYVPPKFIGGNLTPKVMESGSGTFQR